MKLLFKGNKVRILKSDHADISPNTEGVVQGSMEKGYAVEVTGLFGMARKSETRTIYCPATDLEAV